MPRLFLKQLATEFEAKPIDGRFLG